MDCLTEEELKLAQAQYQVPKFAYIYYNDRRQITMISPIKYDNLDYLEVVFDRAKDFLQGKKDFARYDLEYFKSGSVVQQLKEQKIRKSLMYEIPSVDSKNKCDITLIHSKTFWEINLSADAIDSLQRKNLNSSMKFYITKKFKPAYLIKILEIKGLDLLSKKRINFTTEEEYNLDNLSVYVYPEFDSYGLMNNDND
jgi:hypothetical protein